jgi:hypothetical protein
MISRSLPMLLISLAGASWTDAEAINVERHGVVDLKPFACQEITRSSLVNRVCYDASDHAMSFRSTRSISSTAERRKQRWKRF